MAAEPGCCQCCCSLIATLGLTALFMWLSLRTSNPTCSIENIYIPSLNKSLNNPKNTSVYFSLHLKNTNKEKGVYYDDLNLNFFYKPNKTLGFNSTIHGFHQGHGKKATKLGNSSAPAIGNYREEVFRAVLANGSADFRVDLETKVRFEILGWKTKRHTVRVGGDVKVNDQGTRVDHKKGVNVKLNSGCGRNRTTWCLFVFLLILLY